MNQFTSLRAKDIESKLMVTKGESGGKDKQEVEMNIYTLPYVEWRRAWQPTPVFLPGESPWTEVPGGLQSMGSQRV